MIYENTSCIIFLKFLLLLILYFAGLVSSCESHCGDVEILYPFGIGKGCYLEKSYEIQCPNTTSSGRQIPFLSAIGKEVVYISLPTEETFLSSQSSDIVHYLTYGLVRVKTPIISAGCLAGGEEFIESIMNFTGYPFFHWRHKQSHSGCLQCQSVPDTYKAEHGGMRVDL